MSGLGETLLGARGTWALPPSLLYDVYEDTLADILNTLYSLPARMPWPLLRDSVHLTYRTAYDIDRADAHIRSAWLQRADADLRTVLEVLEQLGTVERSVGMASQLFLDDLDNLDAEPGRSSGGTNPVGPGAVLAPADSPNPHAPDVIPGGPADLMRIPDQDDTSRAVTGPVLSRDQAPTLREELTSGPTELIGLTPLATWAVRERLLSEGRDAPLIGELTHATPSELLGVLAEHYPAEAIEQEVERWSAVHGGRPEAFNTLLDAVRRTPFRIRAHDMLRVLCAVLPEDEAHGLLLSLRSDPALAPTALSALVHQEVVHEEDLTDAEHLLLLTESLLSAMEGAGHQAAIDFLQTLGQQEAQAALSAALDSAHPDHTGLEELRTLAGELKAPARPHPRRGAPPTGRSKNHAPTGRKRRRI